MDSLAKVSIQQFSAIILMFKLPCPQKLMSAMKELLAVLRTALILLDHTLAAVTVATHLTVMAIHAEVTQSHAHSKNHYNSYYGTAFCYLGYNISQHYMFSLHAKTRHCLMIEYT